MGGTESERTFLLLKISGSFVWRERSVFLQLLSQGRITLRLTESLQFLLIIRGGIARARHISTRYKNLVESPFDLFLPKLTAQISRYALLYTTDTIHTREKKIL